MGRASVGRFLLVLLQTILFGLATAYAQERDSVLDRRIEYLYHFSQEVAWPNFSDQEMFYIELIGRNADFFDQLKRFFHDKNVRGKEISVSNTRDWRTRNRAIRPNIVYVDETVLHYLPMIVNFFEGYPVLIVSSRPYMEKGWMVSFSERYLDKPYLKDNVSEWGYSLNLETIEKTARLSISMRLRNGALLVIPVQRQTVSEPVEERLNGMTALINAMRIQLYERDSIVKQRNVEIVILRDSIGRQRRQLELIDSFAAVRFLSAAEFLRRISTYDSNYVISRPDIGESIRANMGSLVTETTAKSPANTSPLQNESIGHAFLILSVILGLSGLVASYSLTLRMAKVQQSAVHADDAALLRPGESVAERQLRIQNAFLANVSHELRTPLNAIVGLSQLLVSDADVDRSEMKASLDVINQSAHALLRMMDGVITKAMIDAGEMSLHETLANPLPMLLTLSQESEELLQNMGKRGVVSFAREFAPDIPRTVLLDYDKVQSILGVLLSNAVRFTSLGEVVLGCKIIRKVAASTIRFYVHDTGRGMNAMQVALVTQHFGNMQRQQPAVASQPENAGDSGMGLGLSIACGLAKIIGTQLLIESKPGLGTRVAFELPLRVDATPRA